MSSAFQSPQDQPRQKARLITSCSSWDSCRYDALMKANLPILQRLGTIEKRYAYATSTAPSHYNLLMGLLPHPSPTNVFASTYYKKDFEHFSKRLGIANLGFDNMVPRMWLLHHLKHTLGYYTRAIVSMPVLNPHTPLAVDFDSFEMADKHNDLLGMTQKLRFSSERPTFYLLNTGETHYPYAPVDEPELRNYHAFMAHTACLNE